jgi:hypothetical protein
MQACMANHTILARDLFSFSKIINDLMDAATYLTLTMKHSVQFIILWFQVPYLRVYRTQIWDIATKFWC